MCDKSLWSCLSLCSPIDSSVHGILLGRILEWVAISYSRGSSEPRDETASLTSSLAGEFFTTRATWEPPYTHTHTHTHTHIYN